MKVKTLLSAIGFSAIAAFGLTPELLATPMLVITPPTVEAGDFHVIWTQDPGTSNGPMLTADPTLTGVTLRGRETMGPDFASNWTFNPTFINSATLTWNFDAIAVKSYYWTDKQHNIITSSVTVVPDTEPLGYLGYALLFGILCYFDRKGGVPKGAER